MMLPPQPEMSPAILPFDPYQAAGVVSAAADATETSLREVITEGVHHSASLAWLVKGPAAIALLQSRNISDRAQNALAREANKTGIPVRVLAEDIAHRYERFLALETAITGRRRAITLGLPGLLARPDLSPADQVAGMCELFNVAMTGLWTDLAEIMTP